MAIPFHDRRTGEILYHGTGHPFKKGDMVSPQKEGGFAWATSQLTVAQHRAEHHSDTPKVFQVEPAKDMEPGNRYLGPGTYKSATGFRVIKQID